MKRTGSLRRNSGLARPTKPMERGQMKRRPKNVSAEVRARRKFVASLPCLVCGRRPSEPHHVKPRQMGGKRPDSFDVANLVALCGLHHRLGPVAVEKGRERFERTYRLDLTAEARRIEAMYQQGRTA